MFNKITKLVFIITVGATLTACGGTSTMYGWSGYDSALLKHYKDATGTDELAASLRKIVEKAEERGNSPPGLYADFAFALYESGQVDEAIIYFQKERDTWPESAVFMTSVINRIAGNNT